MSNHLYYTSKSSFSIKSPMRANFILDQIFAAPIEGEVFLRLAGFERLPLTAGQLWLGVSDPLSELLPTALYPAMDEEGQWYLAGSIPSGWQPGDSLNLRGPVGRGFTLPRTSRRVACVSLDERMYYLSPLMRQAFLQAAEWCIVDRPSRFVCRHGWRCSRLINGRNGGNGPSTSLCRAAFWQLAHFSIGLRKNSCQPPEECRLRC